MSGVPEHWAHAATRSRGRTQSISSFRSSSTCDSRTVTTATVSPMALKNFQLVTRLLSRTTFVVFDDGGDIAAAEILLRQILGKGDAAEHLVFHNLSGYSVRNLVTAPASRLITPRRSRARREAG